VNAGTVTIVFFKNAAACNLEICKIAGPGVDLNEIFAFSVSPANLFGTTMFMTDAGPAGQGGFCTFPIPFPCNTVVTVTETGPGGFDVTSITVNPAANAVSTDLANKTATVNVTGFDTAVTFTNATPTPTPTPTATPTPTPTATPTPTPTATPTPTPTPTATPTPTPTPTPNQGCTPGFWKNHPGAFPSPFTASTTLGSVFPCTIGTTFANVTFLQALQGGGGSTLAGAQTILLRAGVAALLNSASVAFPLTTAQVIAEVCAAFSSGDRATILAEATRLDTFNNLGCPLSGGRAAISPGSQPDVLRATLAALFEGPYPNANFLLPVALITLLGESGSS
jgi:hypothetical protein